MEDEGCSRILQLNMKEVDKIREIDGPSAWTENKRVAMVAKDCLTQSAAWAEGRRRSCMRMQAAGCAASRQHGRIKDAGSWGVPLSLAAGLHTHSALCRSRDSQAVRRIRPA